MTPTPDDIRDMSASRELDALVAVEVMGWVWLRFKPAHDKDSEFVRKPYGPDTWEASLENNRAKGDEPLAHLWDYDMPHYSTDIADAWEVVEKLATLEGPVSVCWGIYGPGENRASVATMLAPVLCCSPEPPPSPSAAPPYSLPCPRLSQWRPRIER